MNALLVPPHGGKLQPLLVTGEEAAAARRAAEELRQIRMNSRETSDLIMLASGAFSPLAGFMCREDYQRVVKEMHLADGILWPIPITLSVSEEEAAAIRIGEQIALVCDESNELMGSMQVEEIYRYDKKMEARHVYRTEDENHPGVAKLYSQKEVLIGGRVTAFSEGPYPELYGNDYARPITTRQIFQDKGWRTVTAFQTRNPIHRSHEYCTKIALEISDGLLIHPLVGKLKADDIPADVRMKCYKALIENYYPKDRVVLKVYPMEMRYAGPREAVLHAIIRQNYGCSHIIIGRDHAGVGSYYGPFDAQKIFEEIGEEELAIKPLKIDWTFWCAKCDGMASPKTCPHDEAFRLTVSGTKIREALQKGEPLPEHFTRPEVAEILMDYYQKLRNKEAN
ncbi:MAG: sulfate adenylyltransferase [candidate division KSB1 bacterium]|nr:sulfate adenylyltransferase [candidate division KSB1 bacterium]